MSDAAPLPPVDAEPTVAVAMLEPLAIDAEQFAALIGVSRSMFFKLVDRGLIGPAGVRLGRAIRYPLAEVRAWVDAGMPPRQKWLILRKNGS